MRQIPLAAKTPARMLQPCQSSQSIAAGHRCPTHVGSRTMMKYLLSMLGVTNSNQPEKTLVVVTWTIVLPVRAACTLSSVVTQHVGFYISNVPTGWRPQGSNKQVICYHDASTNTVRCVRIALEEGKVERVVRTNVFQLSVWVFFLRSSHVRISDQLSQPLHWIAQM